MMVMGRINAFFKQKTPYVWYWATCRVQLMADCYIVLLHCCWIILSRNLHRRRRHGYYHFRIQSFVVIEHCYYNERVMIMWSCVLSSSWMMRQLVLCWILEVLLLLNGVVECLSKYHLPSRLLMVLLGLFLVSIFTFHQYMVTPHHV